nr:uncharacterized protein LOC111419803 [Onthophagus taurus]
MPILYKTKLGYILGGGMIPAMGTIKTNTLCAISEQLQKFWEQEEVKFDEKTDQQTEDECERIFIQTTERTTDGKFVVNIPFSENVTELGESRSTALKRFTMLDKKLLHDEQLSDQYEAFMHEYENLGHMSEIHEYDSSEGYYLPHHAVIKHSSVTTKLRTVFDGSAATSSGLSLNDVQLKGPVVQSDLLDILLRFRKYQYVFSADVEKMYRQILINPKQRKYQKIL